MEKKKPLIGIVAWKTGDNSFGCTLPYLTHLSLFGDVLLLTPMKSMVENLDLVFLPGGTDTPSFLYGQPPNYTNSNSDQFKEWFANKLLDKYIDAGVPVFGTCLGMQQLIVKFGGSLCQNLYGHAYSNEYRGELVHELVFEPEYKMLEISLLAKRKSKKKNIETCSLHHQGAYQDKDENNIPDDLKVICKSPDGVVEAIEHKTLPIAGCQFHTEEDYNLLGNHLIKKLINLSPNLKKDDNSRVSSKVQS
jgi:putative glutamine amidotransferase